MLALDPLRLQPPAPHWVLGLPLGTLTDVSNTISIWQLRLRLFGLLFRVSAIRGDGGIVSLNHGLRSRRTDGRPSRVDRGPAADRVDAGGGDRRWEADGRSASGDGGRRVLPSRPGRWLGD